MARIIVIGAVNVDICGKSDSQLLLYDSNPGISRISFGGVGRNIAENICRLGEEVDMITVLGDDLYSNELIAASKGLGINFEHSMFVPGGRCSTYISINNNDGDMMIAVSDMEIYENMTIEFIETKLDFINSHELVFMDTNLPKAIIEYVAEHCKRPLIIDPVSTTKAHKILGILDKVTVIKPNIYEAEVLTDIKINDDNDVKRAARALVEKGIDRVFISMADKGVYFTDGEKSGVCSPYKLEVINTTGCGDSFVAASSWAMLNGSQLEDMAKAGVCASALCANSIDTINREITGEKVASMMKTLEIKRDI